MCKERKKKGEAGEKLLTGNKIFEWLILLDMVTIKFFCGKTCLQY